MELIQKPSEAIPPTIAEWNRSERFHWRILARSLALPLLSLAILCVIRMWPYWPFAAGIWCAREASTKRWLARLMARRADERILSLADSSDPEATFPVRATFLFGSRAYGKDKGMVTFADGYCHFEGQGCWFSLAHMDVLSLAKIDGHLPVSLVYRHIGVDRAVQFEPMVSRRDYEDAKAKLQEAVRAFLLADEYGVVSRFPPTMIQPKSGLLWVRNLQRGVWLAWFLAVVYTGFFDPTSPEYVVWAVRLFFGLLAVPISIGCLYVFLQRLVRTLSRWRDQLHEDE